MCKICSVQGCNGKVVAKGYCNKHYKENKRNGHIKDVVDASDEIAILAQKVLPTTGAYTDATMKEMTAKKCSTKLLKKIDGSDLFIKADPMSFINAKTEEYTMFNGDAGMIKKVQGFRISDVVEEKYKLAAFKLSEAINKNNEIVCLDVIDVGEDISDMPPASELQIAKMLGYKDCSRKFKDCMKSLIESNIIFKLKSKDKKIIDIYYFNPVFQNNGKAVSPRLFFFFYYSFADMAKQSENFRFRFEQMATYSFAWIAAKRADYKEVIANRKQLGELETAKRIVAINAEIAKSYNIKVDFEVDINSNFDDVSQMDLFYARLSGDLGYSNISYEGVTKEFDREEIKKYKDEQRQEEILKEKFNTVPNEGTIAYIKEFFDGEIVDKVMAEIKDKTTTITVNSKLDTSRRTLTLTEVIDKVKKTSITNSKPIPPRPTKLPNSSLIQLIQDTDIEMPLDDSYMDMY